MNTGHECFTNKLYFVSTLGYPCRISNIYDYDSFVMLSSLNIFYTQQSVWLCYVHGLDKPTLTD